MQILDGFDVLLVCVLCGLAPPIIRKNCVVSLRSASETVKGQHGGRKDC